MNFWINIFRKCINCKKLTINPAIMFGITNIYESSKWKWHCYIKAAIWRKKWLLYSYSKRKVLGMHPISQIDLNACVIAWEHVERHYSHHGYLQTVSARSRAIFNNGNMSTIVKCIVEFKISRIWSVYHAVWHSDGVKIFVKDKITFAWPDRDRSSVQLFLLQKSLNHRNTNLSNIHTVSYKFCIRQ